MSNVFYDDWDDPLLMAIMQEQRRRKRTANLPPTSPFQPAQESPFLPPESPFQTAQESPFLPPAAPPSPPEGPQFEEPELEPPGDVFPPPVFPRLPVTPGIPQPQIGAADRLEPTQPLTELVGPKSLGGALAQAIMQASRPGQLGGTRSRGARGWGARRGRGLRSRRV